jgi:predicted aminopeptidase
MADEGDLARCPETAPGLTQADARFFGAELKLPDNPSYRAYADLQRPAAVWNVVAAPALSLS